ncbi:helix-turn-helix domain-containing protein [Cryobacterium cryoconiti]|uniref:Helix-turn-helix domain-containing protein n=1 Tax=Cryobacterium cryoconiti TaxID=1259239 RepID=A0A4Y8JSI5_9MICO|nr:helix-turn-helix domain-containing protein [Cryobacterium cryoconiti]TFD27476.1 helix-turn-helix domain-containing protein [Cryobacterium cryoconiti]
MSTVNEKAVDGSGMAEILDCSYDKVRRMAVAGEIPGFRVGRLWRFFPQAVIAKLSQPRDPWAQSAQSRSRRRAS